MVVKETADGGWDRRRVLQAAGAATVVTGAALGVRTSHATAQGTVDTERRPWRVDTHHHVAPPSMVEWAVGRHLLPADPAGWPNWARWTLPATVAAMAANQIALGVASAPAPSAMFADRGLAGEAVRVINDSMAALVRDNPNRFGFFAYLPLPHVDLCLEEIRVAFDELGADGVLVMTHSGQTSETAKYLGHPDNEPVWAELGRRRAVVFTHPEGLPGDQPALPGVADFVADFMLDTTRTALSLVAAGVPDRHPNLSVILSHAGGFLPYVAGRAGRSEGNADEVVDAAALQRALKWFYYDTAMPASPYATPSLLAAADPQRILYGTDWPQRPGPEVEQITAELDRDRLLNARLRRMIGRDNALRLFPRLATRLER